MPLTNDGGELDLTVVEQRYTAAAAVAGAGLDDRVVAATADVPALLAEVARVRRVAAARMQAANLAAAGRASLAAVRDGEPDPWYYLRDELARTP